MTSLMIWVTLVLYSIGTLLYFIGYYTGRVAISKMAFVVSAGGAGANLLALVARAIAADRLPLANGYEFLLCFVFITVIMYLFYDKRNSEGAGGAVVMLVGVLLTLAIVLLMPGEQKITPLMPALKSPWLSIHVLTAAASYAGFALAAGLAAVKIIRAGSSVREESIHRIVAVGFTLLSLSIVFGAIWAEQAWGTYWSWDPKETWALITWIIYAVYLHLYNKRGWRGKNANLMVIAGFILVLFSFFGVNYLVSGLHSYAGVLDNSGISRV